VLLLPDVVVSLEPPLAPIVLSLELPVPEAPIDVPELPVPLVDGSLLAVLPEVPLVEPEAPLLVLGDALGLAVLLPLLVPLLPLGLVMPPLEPPVPLEPDAPDEPDAPEPAPDPEPPAPPEPWAIDRPPIARAAAAAKAVRVFLVVIMTYSLSGNPEGGG
jgi:hypothetical protein